ncbi:hypothetical protein B0H19DRAFT_1128409 [Mycena capillaripes]|nr:hypothetical protein B0H19DRAFT_1128409 [Mycena capillaripes]
MAPIPRQSLLKVWRGTFLLLAALLGVGFLGAIIRLLLPLGNTSGNVNVVLVEEDPELPAPPPPPIVERVPEVELPATPRLIPLPPTPPATPRLIALPPSPPATPQLILLPPASPRLIPFQPPPNIRQRPPAPLPVRDASTQATCDRMVALLRHTTAVRNVRQESPAEALEREAQRAHRIRVHGLQREIWRRLFDLRLEGAADVEEGAAV